MAKAKRGLKREKKPKTEDALEASGEGALRQLAELRKGFPPVDAPTAASLLAQHNDDVCRERGVETRAEEIFRIAMTWARTFAEHSADPAVSARSVQVRWFMDCLSAVALSITGKSSEGNPAELSALADAEASIEKLLQRVVARAQRAVGEHTAWKELLAKALVAEEAGDERSIKAKKLSELLRGWLAKPGEKSPALSVFGITKENVDELDAAREALNKAIANRPAPKQVGRDSPTTNVHEGRLLFVMRGLWDAVAEDRADGISALQLTSSAALLRGMGLRTKKSKKDPLPAE